MRSRVRNNPRGSRAWVLRASSRSAARVLPHPARIGACIALLAAIGAIACSPPSAEELVGEIIATRNEFEVRLSSWIDRNAGGPDPHLYLDVTVVKNTEESITRLTVLVEQVDAAGSVLNSQRVSLDVSTLDIRGLSKNIGVEVRPMMPSVEGVRLLIEPNPPADVWPEFPEFDRVRPRGQ